MSFVFDGTKFDLFLTNELSEFLLRPLKCLRSHNLRANSCMSFFSSVMFCCGFGVNFNPCFSNCISSLLRSLDEILIILGSINLVVFGMFEVVKISLVLGFPAGVVWVGNTPESCLVFCRCFGCCIFCIVGKMIRSVSNIFFL